MKYIVHIQSKSERSVVEEVLPKQTHCMLAECISEAEVLLAARPVEVLCIDAERVTQPLLDFLRYLHDCFYPLKVLILLRSPSQTDLVTVLEAGADECLGRACYRGLLKIKLRQLLQMQKLKTHDLLTAGSISLAPHSGELWLDQTKVTLRRRESQILQCLLQYKNRVVTRQLLMDHVWMGEEELPADVTIDVYIRRIRMVLREYQHLLTTVRGFGYRLSEPVASA